MRTNKLNETIRRLTLGTIVVTVLLILLLIGVAVIDHWLQGKAWAKTILMGTMITMTFASIYVTANTLIAGKTLREFLTPLAARGITATRAIAIIIILIILTSVFYRLGNHREGTTPRNEPAKRTMSAKAETRTITKNK